MRKLEATIRTARVLLDEMTRIYQEDEPVETDGMSALVTKMLGERHMLPVFHADTFEYDIVLAADLQESSHLKIVNKE